MKERFFLDRVDMLGDQPAIHPAVQPALPVLANTANSGSTFANQAGMSAQVAPQSVILLFVEQGFAHERYLHEVD